MNPISPGEAEPCLHYGPLPSRASRSSIRPSRGGTRVTIIGGDPPREIRCESNLEAKAAYVFLADPDIVDVLEQPPAVAYLDEDGEPHRHTFDFLLTRRSGERILVAIKPDARARAKNLRALLRQIAAYVPTAFAQKIVLITDADLGRDRVHDAKLVWAARRTPDSEADVAVAVYTSDLAGAITIQDLVARTGLEGRAFLAAVRAIANGRLTADAPGIGYRTLVRMPPTGVRPVDLGIDASAEDRP
ncbi:TnsA endonuclease N-terminal domain-containing protein [Methylobacterium komagatae]